MRSLVFPALFYPAVIVLACGAATRAGAQASPGTTSVSAAVTGIHQFTGDFDRGGDVEWSSLAFSAGVTRQFSEATSGGVTGRYGTESWSFGSPVAFGGQAPWTELDRVSLGLSLGQALSRTLVLVVSPSVEWAYAPNAKMEDALIYGAVLSAAKVIAPGRVMGLGVSAYRQFYSVKISPFVIVNWKLTDRLKIANALPAGPEGGAGVELRYQVAADWEFAAGGVYRSDRSRLDADGPYAGGVGETSFIPLFARLSRKLGGKSSLDFYGGVLLNGGLRIKDSAGHEVAADDFATTPAIALTLSLKS